jgi:phenylacetate-CoA oxygenase PaaI subunit
MTPPTAVADAPVESADALPEAARGALRDLLLALSDSKRLLGLRYADWMLGAPSLEAGISASSMAQDEWGHGRLTYALLADFGRDPKALEHERQPEEYRSMQPLDRKPEGWSELIAVALLLDTALTTQYAALVESRYDPVRNRVQKLLDEEAFHFQYAAGWARRIGRSEEAREGLKRAVDALLPAALRWFGPADAAASRALLEEGIVRTGPDDLRQHFLERVVPVLAAALGADFDAEADAVSGVQPLDWDDWDTVRRRAGGGAPDAETIGRARGDKNREMLLD